MSFKCVKEVIELGDVVILYLSPKNMHAIEVLPEIINKNGTKIENVFQTTFGALKVSSLIGHKFGTKIELSRGWGYVLQPTSELWTLTLPHRTQIIYTPDISLITQLLDIKPGSIVIETGTGSGSLSHALIRTVQPNGHLYTFDFHEQRVSCAREEFVKHGLDNFVTIEQRDVCMDGFGDTLKDKVDAIFLDLPHPWLAIEHTVKALKKLGGKLCSFSPCIEQVQRTCLKLQNEGFIEIKTFECLQRELNVLQKMLPIMDLDCLKHKQSDGTKKVNKIEQNLLTVGQPHSVPGHTGFITIATFPPYFIRTNKQIYNEVC